MIEDFNHRAFEALSVHPELGSPALLGLHALAQWFILLVPAGIALLWIFGEARDRRAGTAAVATAVLALLLGRLLSSLLAHPRPFAVEPVRNFLNASPDGAFPSDQAVLFFALAVAFLLRRPPSCPWLGLLFLAGGLAVGWSRVVLGAHYPLDIAGSALIAVAVGPIIRAGPSLRLFDRVTAAAERAYGFVLPTQPRSF